MGLRKREMNPMQGATQGLRLSYYIYCYVTALWPSLLSY